MSKYFTPEGITDKFTALMLSVFLLICGPYKIIVQVKYAAFLVLSIGYIFLMIAAVIISGRKPGKLNTACICAVIYVSLTAASAFISPYFPQTLIGVSRFEGLLTCVLYCAIFVCMCRFGKLTKEHICIFALTMILICSICILQLAGLNPFWLYPDGMNYYDAYTYYTGEYMGTIGNADFLSAIITLAMPIFCVSAVKFSGKTRYITSTGAVMCAAVLIKAGVVSGIVGICTGIVLLLFLLLGKRKKYFLLFVTAASICTFFVIYVCNFFHLRDVIAANVPDSWGSGRIKIWRQVLGLTGQYLWFGTGPDTMYYWNLEGFSRYIPEIGKTVSVGIDAAHNEFMQIMAMQGLPALMAYLSTVILTVRDGVKCRNTIALLPVLCYLVQSFFNIGM